MCNIKQDISNSNEKSVDFYQSHLFNLSEVRKKPVEVRFNLDQTSSDGGLLLLKEAENQIGIIGRFAFCIDDPRHQGYVQHDINTPINQGVMQIAAGYEACRVIV